ncbi:MAG: AMP-binding protein [Myxococcota bacterium]
MNALPHPLQSATLTRSQHPLLCVDGQTWTAKALRDAVGKRAGALMAQGVHSGHTVGLLGIQDAQWVIDMHAVGWLGAVVMPLSSTSTYAELSAMFKQHRPDWLIDKRPHAEQPDDILQGQGIPILQQDLAHNADTIDRIPAERFWPFNELRVRLFTSGSTAAPKLVELSTAQLFFSAMGSALRLGHGMDDRWLCCLPLHHIGGLSILWRCAWYGTTVLLHDHFSAQAVNHTIDNQRVTQVSLVPTMLRRLLDERHERPFPKDLRFILLGGGAADLALRERCEKLCLPVAYTWGMSETASQITTTFPGEHGAGVGTALPFARVTISSPDTETLLVAGPLVHTPLTTDDTGHIATDGNLHLHGRSDEVIITGGENVAPSEVEEVLTSHPAVTEAVVLGQYDDEWGQRLIAWVATPSADSFDPNALHAWCSARLAGFKRPKHYVLCQALPRTGLGKLDRHVLRTWQNFETGAQQTLDERFWQRYRREGIHTHTGVHQTQPCSENVVLAANSVGQRERTLTDASDIDSDSEILAHMDRSTEIGFGVDHGQSPPHVVEGFVPASKSMDEQLLVGNVAVLKKPTEENNASVVDIVKARREPMFEGHECSHLSQSATPDGGDDHAGP